MVLVYYREGHGIGDVINYVRYAKRLSDAGAHVIVQARSEVKPLLSLCPYIKQVFSLQDQIPSVDIEYKDQAASVLRMITNSEELSLDVPYLYADQKLIEHWKEQLSVDTNFKVGLCWESVPCRNVDGTIGLSPRSVTLAQLEKLKGISGVSFYSLQKFVGEKGLRQKADDFIIHEFDGDFDQSHGRLMDTAAVMKNLDLVITVDTSIAHLAGALGVPVWTLVMHNSDFRWLKDRSDTPWYPTMQLFRQQKRGDWESVIQQIVEEIKKLLAGRS